MVSDLIGSCGHLRPILPRSRHLPAGLDRGKLPENLNKIGVRFWTDCSGADPQPCCESDWRRLMRWDFVNLATFRDESGRRVVASV